MWGAGAKSEYKRSQMKDKLLKQRFSSGIDEENRKRNKKEEGEEGGGATPLLWKISKVVSNGDTSEQEQDHIINDR